MEENEKRTVKKEPEMKEIRASEWMPWCTRRYFFEYHCKE